MLKLLSKSTKIVLHNCKRVTLFTRFWLVYQRCSFKANRKVNILPHYCCQVLRSNDKCHQCCANYQYQSRCLQVYVRRLSSNNTRLRFFRINFPFRFLTTCKDDSAPVNMSRSPAADQLKNYKESVQVSCLSFIFFQFS
jgi:hypothetical protein